MTKLNTNRATLLGRAGRNPNVRDLKNCDKAAVFTLAISGIGRCYSSESPLVHPRFGTDDDSHN
ncbi:MAG: hypothetical protein OXC26_06335 [Albidovulum sp.]|nr:hypothetical protein [Albidovulum sp.]